ncbi:hypothetical protein IGJ53_002334 [Enterococcus sp. DIV1283b]
MFIMTALSGLLVSTSIFSTVKNIDATVRDSEVAPSAAINAKQTDSSAMLVTNKTQLESNSVKASLSTGFETKFVATSVDQYENLSMDIETTRLVGGGIGAIFDSELTVDPYIAEQLFSVPNWKDYLVGEVEFPYSDWYDGVQDIQQLIERGTKNENYQWIKYDANSHRLTLRTKKYDLDLGFETHVDWHITFDMNKFHKDYPDKLVKQEHQYEFQCQTGLKDWSITIGGAPASTYFNYYPEQDWDWVEGDIQPTSLNYDEQYKISGNAKQSENTVYSNYFVELAVNGELITNNISLDGNGSWTFDGAKLNLKEGDVLEARVGHVNPTGIKNYSVWTEKTIGEGIPYDKWNVNSPRIVQPEEGDTSVTIDLPKQNLEKNRTYEYVVTADDQTVKGYYDGQQSELGVSFTKLSLVKGHKVSAYIVGHEPDKEDKNSEVVDKIVVGNSDHPFDSWVVNAPQLTEAKVGEANVSIQTPDQDPYLNRSYVLKTYVNERLIDSRQITTLGSMYSISNIDDDGSIIPFKHGDVIKSIIEGHQEGNPVKQSSEVQEIVKDDSDYDGWTIKAPMVRDGLFVGDEKISVDIPKEDTNYNRTYSVEILIDDKVATTVERIENEKTINVQLNKPLQAKQQVTAIVIGHQPNCKDKQSSVSDEVIVKENQQNITAQDVTAYVGDEIPSDEAFNASATDKAGNEIEVTIDKSRVDMNTAGDYDVIVKAKDEQTKTVKVHVLANQQNITAQDVTAYVGDEIPSDEAFNASATDKAGNEIEVTIDKSRVDMNTAGDYDVIVKAKDGQTKTVKVHVKEHKKATTTNWFKRTYWQDYGMVYEGQLNNLDWDMSQSSNLLETINIVDASGRIVANVPATPTNWYTPDVYNGFQFIIDINTLARLSEGIYSFQIQVTAKDIPYDAVQLTNKVGLGTSLYHDDYEDLEGDIEKGNFIKPILEGNIPKIRVSKQSVGTAIKQVNSYFNDSMQYVLDGYVQLDNNQNIKDLTKELVITNQSGEEVYRKENLPTVSTNWDESIDVDLATTFQAIVPMEYTTTTPGVSMGQYIYTVNVKDSSGEILASQDLS